MASSENEIVENNWREEINVARTITDDAEMEMSLKREKALVKSNFTRSRRKVWYLLEQPELPRRQEILVACESLENKMESAMRVPMQLSDLYVKIKEKEKNKKVVLEVRGKILCNARRNTEVSNGTKRKIYRGI